MTRALSILHLGEPPIDASAGSDVTYRAMLVREEDFEQHLQKMKDFTTAQQVFV